MAGIVYCCSNCKRLVTNTSSKKCSKCGGNYVSLGVDSSKWSALTNAQKNQLIDKKTSAASMTSKSVASEAISDIFLWILAIAQPVISMIMLSQGSNISGIGEINWGIGMIFVGLDLWQVKKSDYELSNWLLLLPVFSLAPIYLFVRAAKSNKNYKLGII